MLDISKKVILCGKVLAGKLAEALWNTIITSNHYPD